MSTNLDLLSDSTFGTKLDAQNAILEDIRDNISGSSVPDATTSTKGVVTLARSVTSGDTTHVPTADAVYNAIQQSAEIQWLVPKPPTEASVNDDVIVTPTNAISTPVIDTNYSISGRTISFDAGISKNIWLKRSTFNINDDIDVFNKISVILNDYNSKPGMSIIASTNDYWIIRITLATYSNAFLAGNTFKIMYTP